VEFWIVNTDVQAMRMSPVNSENWLPIGQELTRGLGAGGDPEIGMNVAKESKESIHKRRSMEMIWFLLLYVQPLSFNHGCSTLQFYI
jgi:cell division GTPase FtsZ